MRRACGLKLPAPRPALRCARRRSGGQGISLDLLHASERTGKGPEGRKTLAQGASPGSRKHSGSREPQRGERKGLDVGTLSRFCRPFRGLNSAVDLASQGSRPGLSSIARQTGSRDHAAAAVSFYKFAMQQRQDSHFYVAHPALSHHESARRGRGILIS
jgi:hypothetical protein